MRGACLLALALALSIGPANPALAARSTSLEAALTPERLGHGTTIEFGVHIAAQAGTIPSPLTQLTLSYPPQLGLARSGLGLATCTPTILQVLGPEGCPADSRVGYGSATAEILASPEIQEEVAAMSIFMAPIHDGRVALLLYANGMTPVSAQLVLTGLLLPAPAPFGGALTITTPLIPSWPAGPDISIVSLRSTIGSQGITYYEHTRGKTIPYHPQSILLPTRCPHDGFPFAATLSFQDGSHATAHTTVPCPRHGGRHRPTSG